MRVWALNGCGLLAVGSTRPGPPERELADRIAAATAGADAVYSEPAHHPCRLRRLGQLNERNNDD
jgi:hypothetical protein